MTTEDRGRVVNPNLDPRCTRDFMPREYLFTDCPEWAFRQWGILSNGDTLKNSIDNCIERLCILMNGQLQVQIYVKQMTQIEEGAKEYFVPVPRHLIQESYTNILSGTVEKKENKHKRRAEYREYELTQVEE